MVFIYTLSICRILGIVICQKIGGHAIEKKNIKAIDEVDQGHAIFTEMTEGNELSEARS